MTACLTARGRIEIRGFGKFSLHFRRVQVRRSPKTQTPVSLPSKYVPHFNPGRVQRERVDRLEHATHAWTRTASVSESGNAWNPNILLVGDMNVPSMEGDESTIKALRSFGWTSIDYPSDRTAGVDARHIFRIGFVYLGNDRTCDQIAFSSAHMKRRICRYGCSTSTTRFSDRSGPPSAPLTRAERRLASSTEPVRKAPYLDHRPLWMWSCAPTRYTPCSITQRAQPGSMASGTASGVRACFRAHAAPSLSASAVVVARRPAAHRSRSDLR